MSRAPLYSLRVPATSANLGAGFDSMGMALSLYNIFNVTELLPEGEFRCSVIGEGAAELSDPKNNLLFDAYLQACEAWGIKPRGFALEAHNSIPLARGLGSSSTAVVGGVTLAQLLSGRSISRNEQLRLMAHIEGHPDNVVPCFVGGMTVSCWDGETLRYVKLPTLPDDLHVVAAVPEVTVSTKEARKALPKTVPFEDAVFNVSHASLLCAAWAMGRWDLLAWGMEDRLHQSYRARLFPGGQEILDNIRKRPDCLSVAISGSGPTMIALVQGPPGQVASAMCRTFSKYSIPSQFFVLSGAPFGTIVETHEGEAADSLSLS